MILSIDIGGTSTKFALISSNWEISKRITIPTIVKSTREFETNLFSQIHHFVKCFNQIETIAVCAPAVVGNEIVAPANLPFTANYPIELLIKKEFGLPVKVVKDSLAFLLGELHFGTAKDLSNIVLLNIGAGLGSAQLVDGLPLSSQKLLGSEIGHTIIQPSGRTSVTGRLGTAESYISAKGLKQTYHEILLLNEEVPPRSLSARGIFEKAKEGDKHARKALDVTADYLGILMSNIIHFSSPEAIILVGSLMEASEFIVGKARAKMNELLLDSFKQHTQIIVGKLPAFDAALLGTAYFATHNVEHIYKKVI